MPDNFPSPSNRNVSITSEGKQRSRIILSATAIVAFHVLGFVFPEEFWGSNYVSFLPNWALMVFIAIGAMAIGYNFRSSPSTGLPQYDESVQENIWIWLRIMIPLLAAVFVHSTPIARDVYGDAYFLTQELDKLAVQWTSEMTANALSYHPLVPKEGVRSFYHVTNFLGYIFQTKSIAVVKYLQVFLVIIFNMLWMALVTRSCKTLKVRLLLSMVVFVAPIGLIFHRHYEVYAIPMVLAMAFVLLLKVFFAAPNFKRLFALFFLLLIGLKFHITFWLLTPALLFAFLHLLGIKQPWFSKFSKPKMVLLFMLLPGVMAVCAVYIWKGSFHGTRLAPPGNLYDALFVPMVPSEPAPYDRYSLLSLAHVLDYLQVIFVWSPVAWFVVMVAFLNRRFNRTISPYVLCIGLVFVGYLCCFFIINPLLGMSTDWDLFSFPSIILLALSAEVLSRLEREKWINRLIIPAALLSLLNTPCFAVNASNDMLSERYEVLFRNDFKHFWIASSTLFKVSMEMEENKDIRMERHLAVIKDLEPYAVLGQDLEFAEVLRLTGVHSGRTGNLQMALEFHQRALRYFPNLRKNIFDLVIVHFNMGQPRETLPYLDRLIANQYPSDRKAHLIAIHSSIAAKDYDRARFYCTGYLRRLPKDAFIGRVFQVLSSEKPSEAIQLFASG